MPWANCVNKECIYYDETERGRCQLESIKITEEGECSDKEVEFRRL